MEETSNIKVLVVEDDSFLMNAYTVKLSKEGFDVLSATDGTEGLKKAQEIVPHIILLDILMPNMNGLEMLEKIKKQKKLVHIPVILLSNLGQKEEIEKGLALGATDYLIKANISMQEVIEKIKELSTNN